MTRFLRRFFSTSVGALVVAGLVSCSSATAGNPVASGDAESTTPPSSTSSTSNTSTSAELPDYSNEGLCALLTAEEAEQFGGSPSGEPGNSIRDGHPQCQWTADTSLLIGFQKGLQSTNAPTGPNITNTPTTVDGLTAMQSQNLKPVEVCQVLVDVSSDTIIYVSATLQAGGEGKFVPCDVANQLIKIVIPKVTQR